MKEDSIYSSHYGNYQMVATNKVAKQYPWMNEDNLYSSDYRVYQIAAIKKVAK